ncbi:hypothetical protein GCM10009839_57400 [Catenulispora yoronensis]|uniref:Uncharacterized protein n=1 Tax=Catenulispora yoronensis TaxID=450799 RepID=A0ABN2UXZ7_9ACTN
MVEWRPVAVWADVSVNGRVSKRRRGAPVLGEYELEGGAFGPAGRAERSDRRDTRGGWSGAAARGADVMNVTNTTGLANVPNVPNVTNVGSGRTLSRPGSLWKAVLRRIRTR